MGFQFLVVVFGWLLQSFRGFVSDSSLRKNVYLAWGCVVLVVTTRIFFFAKFLFAILILNLFFFNYLF